MLIFALTVHYLPLAIGPIGASLAQVSPGSRRLPAASAGARSSVPLDHGAAGARRHPRRCGTGLPTRREGLPATLILAPIGFETLATEIWTQTSFGFYEASAIPSLILLAIAAPRSTCSPSAGR
jgi:iron(III) transport system permease protein